MTPLSTASSSSSAPRRLDRLGRDVGVGLARLFPVVVVVRPVDTVDLLRPRVVVVVVAALVALVVVVVAPAASASASSSGTVASPLVVGSTAAATERIARRELRRGPVDVVVVTSSSRVDIVAPCRAFLPPGSRAVRCGAVRSRA